jgi:hypothetical protein
MRGGENDYYCDWFRDSAWWIRPILQNRKGWIPGKRVFYYRGVRRMEGNDVYIPTSGTLKLRKGLTGLEHLFSS